MLDTWTGEVVKVPEDGSPAVVLRSAVIDPETEGTPVVPSWLGPTGQALTVSMPVPGIPVSSSGIRVPPESSMPHSWTAFDHEVISAFPYPIARTYRSFLIESDPRQRCKLLVDTFTHVIKLWALQTSSEYLNADDVEDITVNHTLGRDFQRPLISAWNLMLARCLPVLEEHGVTPFAPELARAYRELESECRDQVSLETRYKDVSGESRIRTSRLGRIQALIRYRNSLAHGYNQSHDKALRDLDTYVPVLLSVLAKARFTTRYPLYYAPSPARRGRVSAYRLMGASPSGTLERISFETTSVTESSLFLYDPGIGRVLPMHLFLDIEDLAETDDGPTSSHGVHAVSIQAATDHREAIAGLGWDVLSFEGHTRTTVIYAAVSGQRVEKQAQLETWRTMLARKAAKSRALTLDSMTWERLTAGANHTCREVLSALEHSGRYIPAVSIPRPRFEAYLDDFERSDYRAFVVAGNVGMGKTTLLARYAEARVKDGDLVLFYRAAGLRDTRIADRILRDLGIRNAFFEDFLAGLQHVVPDGRRVRLIVDSLHEHSRMTYELVRAIDGLVEQVSSYGFFRVLVSIRSAAYERLPPDARFGHSAPENYFAVEQQVAGATRRTVLVEVPPMTAGQVAVAYEKYRTYRRPESDEHHPGVHAFRPITAFSELAADGATVALMRVPLFLRLLTAAHVNRPLPPNLSFDQAMEPYMDTVVIEQGEPGGGYPERGRFLQNLVRLLDQESADSVARDRLYQVPKLAAHLTNPQKDSAYVQLLELGLLQEDWDGDACTVRFAFDGMFEYLLAALHYPRIEGPSDLLALVERALGFKSLRAALVSIMRQAIRTGRHALVLDACDQCPVDDPRSEDASVLLVDVVRDLLVDLARFRDPGFSVLCNEIADTASRFDVEVLSAAFDELFYIGEILAADRVIELAAISALSIGHNALRAEALLRWATIDQQRGLPDTAYPKLDEARALAESAGATLLCHRIDLIHGRFLVTTGDRERAAAMFEEAHRGLVALEQLGDASVAIRGLASIAARSDRLERAETLGRQAIALAERARDLPNMARALNNLAMVKSRRGDVSGALQSFEQSLAIKQKIGHRASMAITENNLGALYFGRGDVERASHYWRGALVTFEALEHREACAWVLCNLAVLAGLHGDDSEAARYLDQSVSLFDACGELDGMAQAMWYQGALALERGRVDEARDWTARLGKLDRQLDTVQTRIQHASLILRLATRAEDPETEAKLSDLERQVDEHDALDWDVESGPASALLDGASYLAERGERERARRLAQKVRDSVGIRPFVGAASLKQLLDAQVGPKSFDT